MSQSQIVDRYAKALYGLSKESNEQDKVFAELREVKKVFTDNDIQSFANSPLTKPSEKAEAIEKTLNSIDCSKTLKNFLYLLTSKGRLAIFADVVEAYEKQIDEAHGVTRGTVRSATVLSPEERQQIEDKVTEVTGKKVIMSYMEDSSVIGGLIAKVGSYTFDDTLTTHLRRLKEDLKRRTH